jgi:hypothetical protein
VPNDGTANSLKVFVGETVVGGSGQYWEMADVQLEAGTVATSFRRNAPSIQAELAACQRYYYQTDGVIGDELGVGAFWTAALFFFQLTFPVTMRTRPSISTNNATGFMTYVAGSTRASTAFSLNNTSTNVAMGIFTTAGGANPGDAGWGETNATGAVIRASSEL